MSFPLIHRKIVKEWIDYNGHMNLSYYILIFDMGAEIVLSKFEMGEQAAKIKKRSTMVVETYTNYIKEIKENDEVVISLTYLDHDKKRLHYKLAMHNKSGNILSATTEVLALYIDLNKRKVSEFENDKIGIIASFIEKNKSNFNNEDLKFSSKLKK